MRKHPFIIILLIIGLFISPLIHLPYIDNQVYAAGGWVSPTGHNDSDSKWLSETNAYDGNISTSAYTSEIEYYLELNRTSIYCDKVRIYTTINSGDFPTPFYYDADIDIDVYYSGGWHNIFSGYVANHTWVEKAIGSIQQVTAARVKDNFEAGGAGGAYLELYELEFNEIGLPTVTTQAATSIEETTCTGNGNITNTGGENCDSRGVVYDTSSHGDPGNVSPLVSAYSDNRYSNGSFGTGAFTQAITGLSPGTKYYLRAYAHNSAGYEYGGEVEFTTKANGPSNLAETSTTVSSISTNWTKGTGAEKTMVRYQTVSYPTDYFDGTQAYFDTSNTTTVNGLDAGTTYYFRAWSYKTDAPNGGYSDGYSSDTATTNASIPAISTVNATQVTSSSARLNAYVSNDGGQACDVRFQYNVTTLPFNATNCTTWTHNTTWINDTYSTGDYPYNDTSGLVNSTTYAFRGQVRNDNTTVTAANILWFTTPSGLEPPTNFKAYPASHDTDLTWIKGNGSAYTYIRVQVGDYPANTTDGDLVYNNTSTSETYEGLSPGVSYFYRAWGSNGTGYSENYTDVMATTYAGAGAGVSPSDPETPATWWATPDYTNLANFTLYPIINDMSDDYGVPRNTMWTLLTIILIMVIGIIIYSVAHQPAVAIISVAGLMWFASIMGLMPLWIAFVYSVPALSIMLVARRT